MTDRPALEEEAELHRTEVLVSTVLRVGVLVSAALVAVGLVIHLARGGTDPGSAPKRWVAPGNRSA